MREFRVGREFRVLRVGREFRGFRGRRLMLLVYRYMILDLYLLLGSIMLFTYIGRMGIPLLMIFIYLLVLRVIRVGRDLKDLKGFRDFRGSKDLKGFKGIMVGVDFRAGKAGKGLVGLGLRDLRVEAEIIRI